LLCRELGKLATVRRLSPFGGIEGQNGDFH